jgi:hypothetical protein
VQSEFNQMDDKQRVVQKGLQSLRHSNETCHIQRRVWQTRQLEEAEGMETSKNDQGLAGQRHELGSRIVRWASPAAFLAPCGPGPCTLPSRVD